MPLPLAPVGEQLTVKKVLAAQEQRRHLESLGIAAGSSLSLLSAAGGSIILRVKDGRLALDKNMATKIFVTVKEDK